MRLGSFGHISDIDTIARAGFDSAELDLMEIARLSENQFQALKVRARDAGLRFEAFSGFMPLTERIHDPAFRADQWLAHAALCARRTRELGATLWPMGVGKCRSIPDGCRDIPAAEARAASFFGGIAGIVGEYGILLVVEPLGPANSNYLQTIGDTAAFVQAIGLPNCRIMCDLRHMLAAGDPLTAVAAHIGMIRHAHVDYPFGTLRRYPSPSDGFDYRPYLAALKHAGYDRILTVEAIGGPVPLPDAAHSARYLRALWAEV